MVDELSDHTAVVGLQWGDEGKGKVVDLLAGHFDVTVRFNGGANAGHSVVVAGEKYALHLVPCGILQPRKMAVLGNGVVVDPEVLIAEIEELTHRGIPVEDRLRLSDRAHVVMPYHKTADRLLEAASAAGAGARQAIGTTGRGIGPCYADKATRTTAIRVADLVRPHELAARLPYLLTLKNATLAAVAAVAGMSYEPFAVADIANWCAAQADRLSPLVTDTGALLRQAIAEGRRLLFEGANGFLLDVDHGTYPYVTSSNASALGIAAGAGVPPRTAGEIVGVVKAYTSRVGGGPFPTELADATGERIRERGHEYGTTTGRPRRCGWLDLVAVRYAAQTSGATRLAVTLLDVLAGLDELRLCVAYRLGSQTTTRFPASAAELAAVEPVYETLAGFDARVAAAGRYGDLPAAARAYLERIEDYVGIPIWLVSVGPERSQTLWRSSG